MRSAFVLLLLTLSFQPILALEPSAEPIARWNFENAIEGETTGKISLDQQGPAPPLYPDFEDNNRALVLKAPAYVVLPEDSEGKFQFDNGDPITVEAWVNLQSLAEHAYVIGKGRTKSSDTNQNWAFRLRKRNGLACVNFLFRSRDDDGVAGDWHRWTAVDGFAVGSGWHHVAISYQFGQPKSIRGFLDGKTVRGTWDMGGPTERPPVVDDAQVWIGSSMGGHRGNSFSGQIDDLAVYRAELSEEVLSRRYRFVPQPIQRPEIPEGAVVAQMFGPFGKYDGPPVVSGQPELSWQQDAVAITALPAKYDSWGVRDDWTIGDRKAMMLRLWTKLKLDPGDYQLMIRSRGFSRLVVDDQELAATPKQRNRSGAHHVVDPLPKVSVAGMRPHFMNDHESVVDFHSEGGTHEVLLELMVGGPNYRLEVGETCAAIAVKGEMFHVLSPSVSYPLTDQGWENLAKTQQVSMQAFNTERRRQAGHGQTDYWNMRHQYARENLLASRERPTIDQLISKRIQQANAQATAQHGGATEASPDEAFFIQHIQPIFQTHCVRCHGEKQQGELTVLERERLLAGGESGEPAVVPGAADESYLMELVAANPDDYRMPPKGDGLSAEEIAAIRKWIDHGAAMPAPARQPIEVTEPIDDYAFLRRVFIDTVGVAPTLKEANAFLSDRSSDARAKLIDALLDDPRWADNWVGYWQDALAENPNLLKPTLNNTGPFRYWIYEALADNKPVDRFATELMMMRGSKWYGGAAGFAIASQNDVPMAAKSHVIGTAFLGVDMKCARCHDAPYHSWKQSDLFQMAAMLDRKPIKLPESSTVPAAFFEKQQRKPLIDVTLKPGATVRAEWPFAELSAEVGQQILQDPSDAREVLAAQVTASRRFAEVIANRIWARVMGAGIVQPLDDWEGNPPSDPELLSALADILIESGYDQKALVREILGSKAYQREATKVVDKDRFFAGPYRRRMSAEQIVDSALHAVGVPMATEQLTLDVEGTLPADKFLNFGFPTRSWEFTTLANERDRPSLALPKVQAITDVLKAFGWRNSRPEPTSTREETPNLIQPGVLANGTLGVWLTRLSDQNEVTQLAIDSSSVNDFINDLFLQILTRKPTQLERRQFLRLLSDGFDGRLVAQIESADDSQRERHRYVSWSNHLNTEANVIKVQMQEEVRAGPPPTRYLNDDWRSRAEDAVWALVNSPEMILIP